MNFINYIKGNGFGIFEALIILLLGFLIARIAKTKLLQLMSLRSKDTTAINFVVNAIYSIILIIILITVLSKLGIPTASLLTVLGAGSLAIGLALKNSLGNIASGLLLVTLKPFRVGDSVDIGGVAGVVNEINLFTTRLKSANNESIYLPNAKVMTDKICNKSFDGTRRIDLTVGIGYNSDLTLAKNIVQNILEKNDLVLKNPSAAVVVKELADSAVLLGIRPWVKKKDYGTVLYFLTEEIKLEFDKQNIEIPYPQLVVTTKN